MIAFARSAALAGRLGRALRLLLLLCMLRHGFLGQIIEGPLLRGRLVLGRVRSGSLGLFGSGGNVGDSEAMLVAVLDLAVSARHDGLLGRRCQPRVPRRL